MPPSTLTAEFAAANDSFSKLREPKMLPVVPSRHIAVVTCMDSRIDVFRLLGLKEGEAHIIRNGGGRAPDEIRSLVASQRALETREIAIFHHTDCGFTHFKEPELREKIKSAEGPAIAQYVDSIAFMPFEDPAVSVVEDIEYLKAHPLILKETKFSGWVHDLESGKIRQVA
ncbi:carbonic anhydrase [Ceratobasidium sp. AG-Ba]|nr:carbonic anhydrase [Ceratobasidium sp. AG-Ba]